MVRVKENQGILLWYTGEIAMILIFPGQIEPTIWILILVK